MPKKVWFILIAMVINVVGSSFFWPFNTIYIHDYLGKSVTVAGIVLMFNAMAALVGNVLGGKMFDKFGGFPSIMVGASISIVSSIILNVRHDFLFYSVFIVMLGFGSGIIFPSMYALIGSVWKEGKRKAFNALYLSINIGVAIAPVLGGYVASKNIEYLFIANTFFNIILFILIVTTFRNLEDGIEYEQVRKEKTKISLSPAFISLILICTTFALCWFTYIQWQSTIAAHVQEMVGIQGYSLLWTVNGAIIIFGQPILNLVIKFIVKTSKQQVILGIIIFICAYIVAGMAGNFKMIVISMIVLSIGEMLVWPAIPTIGNSLAPPEKLGFYQGIVSGSSTVGKMFGPVVGGLIVDIFGIHTLFIVLCGVLIVAMGIALIHDRNLDKITDEQIDLAN